MGHARKVALLQDALKDIPKGKKFKVGQIYSKPNIDIFIANIVDCNDSSKTVGEVHISRRLGSDTWIVRAIPQQYWDGSSSKDYFSISSAKHFTDFEMAKKSWKKLITDIVS